MRRAASSTMCQRRRRWLRATSFHANKQLWTLYGILPHLYSLSISNKTQLSNQPKTNKRKTKQRKKKCYLYLQHTQKYMEYLVPKTRDMIIWIRFYLTINMEHSEHKNDLRPTQTRTPKRMQVMLVFIYSWEPPGSQLNVIEIFCFWGPQKRINI